MTREITGYIAAGFEVGAGKPNTALDRAATLSLDDVEAAMLGSSAPAPVKENQNGSFERFMGALGGNGGRKPGQ